MICYNLTVSHCDCDPAMPRNCTHKIGRSDVKFHEFFCLEIFLEIFHEIFQKFHDVFSRLYTHPFNIFYTSNITLDSTLRLEAA